MLRFERFLAGSGANSVRWYHINMEGNGLLDSELDSIAQSRSAQAWITFGAAFKVFHANRGFLPLTVRFLIRYSRNERKTLVVPDTKFVS